MFTLPAPVIDIGPTDIPFCPETNVTAEVIVFELNDTGPTFGLLTVIRVQLLSVEL
jgi:hypothetical protein